MIVIKPRLRHHCRISPERTAWLKRLPDAVAEAAARWQLTRLEPLEGGEASWVADAVRHDGSLAVLKLGMPHPEAAHEADGLRFWDGDPTVRLLEADDALGAMLLERCDPGTPLSALPDAEQDEVLAGLLPRLWKMPPADAPFLPLSTMIEGWIAETLAQEADWVDAPLVRAGIEVFRTMAGSAPSTVLLATDVHAGNVLRARRRPWLVIDPKPFVGDPAYDATQHLLNGHARMSADPVRTIERYSGLLGVEADRVRRWTFARLAAEPREDWKEDRWLSVARALA